MISTQIAKSGLFRFTVCPFPAFITILANAEIVSSRWMLLLFLDLYITLNCNSIKSNLLVLTLYRAKILTMHFDFDPVQEIVWSRVTKFVTVENVTDWEAKISRRQSNLRNHLQLSWSMMHIYREVKLKIGGMTKLNSNKHFLHFKCHAQEHNTLSWSGLDSSHTFQSACYWLDHFVALFTPM